MHVCIAFANNNLNWDVSKNGLIADIHNSAKVWVSHGEYTISESNAGNLNFVGSRTSLKGIQI